MIQIDQPELEALIQQRLSRGPFSSIEEVLLQAVSDAPLPKAPLAEQEPRSGADLLRALQDSPFQGLDIDFEAHRGPLPVREIKW